MSKSLEEFKKDIKPSILEEARNESEKILKGMTQEEIYNYYNVKFKNKEQLEEVEILITDEQEIERIKRNKKITSGFKKTLDK